MAVPLAQAAREQRGGDQGGADRQQRRDGKRGLQQHQRQQRAGQDHQGGDRLGDAAPGPVARRRQIAHEAQRQPALAPRGQVRTVHPGDMGIEPVAQAAGEAVAHRLGLDAGGHPQQAHADPARDQRHEGRGPRHLAPAHGAESGSGGEGHGAQGRGLADSQAGDGAQPRHPPIGPDPGQPAHQAARSVASGRALRRNPATRRPATSAEVSSSRA
ncbi:hypothetical protein [Paracoccus sp. 22332]|uniref:hypothetical protein n=1 Tax=Paracoccus sp. 22332 TaxID=3453913 RepID=UPI003F834B94